MSLPVRSERKTRFGDFELDLRTGELRNNGHKFLLQGQPFQVLSILLEQPGQLVSREELKRRLWASDTFVDFDHSLNKAVNRLREALKDSADKPRYIETLPRRGYRLVAPVLQEKSSGTAFGQVHDWPSTTETVVASSSGPIVVTTETKAGRQGQVYVALSVLSLLALAVAGLIWWPRSSPGHSVNFENLQITKLTDSGRAITVAISPDGRYVAYAVLIGEKQALRLRQVATRRDVELLPPDAGNFVGLTFSPDGNYIYFVRSDKNDMSFRYLYSISSLGGTPQKIITDVDSSVGFSPDGREIAYEHWVRNDMELKVANADGTGERLLTVVHNANFMSPGDPGPNWSPDGRTLVFSKLLVSKKLRYVLYAVSVADGAARELYSTPFEIGRPVWLPSGKNLLIPCYEPNLHRGQIWTVSFPEGVARRFTHDVSDYAADLDLTKDGGTAAAIMSTGESHIWSFHSTDPTRGRQITFGEPAMYEVRETAEGKILSAGGDGVPWTMNADGSEGTPLGSLHDIGGFAACGRYFIFSSYEDGSIALTRVNADGTHPAKLASGTLSSPSCAQDNEFVYYANLEQPEKIWRVPMAGGAPVEVGQILGDSLMGSVTVSPDGKMLAYPYSTYSTTAPARHLTVVPAAGGPPVRTFDMPGDSWTQGPYWTADGKALEYVRTQDGVSGIWEQSVAGGPPKQLIRFTAEHIFDFHRSQDHTRLFVSQGSVKSDIVLLRGFR